MVLGVRAQEDHPVTEDLNLLADGQAESARVELFSSREVLDEQARRSDPHGLEGSREQDSADVVAFGQVVRPAVAGRDVDAVRHRIGNLGDLGLVGEVGVALRPRPHCLRLAQSIPADLLDPVLELIAVAGRIREVCVPVRPGVTPVSIDLLTEAVEPLACLDDFAQAARLPRDLVDRDVFPRGLLRMIGPRARHDDEGVVIAVVAE